MLKEKESGTRVPRKTTISPPADQSEGGHSCVEMGILCLNRNRGRRQKHAQTGTQWRMKDPFLLSCVLEESESNVIYHLVLQMQDAWRRIP